MAWPIRPATFLGVPRPGGPDGVDRFPVPARLRPLAPGPAGPQPGRQGCRRLALGCPRGSYTRLGRGEPGLSNLDGRPDRPGFASSTIVPLPAAPCSVRETRSPPSRSHQDEPRAGRLRARARGPAPRVRSPSSPRTSAPPPCWRRCAPRGSPRHGRPRSDASRLRGAGRAASERPRAGGRGPGRREASPPVRRGIAISPASAASRAGPRCSPIARLEAPQGYSRKAITTVVSSSVRP